MHGARRAVLLVATLAVTALGGSTASATTVTLGPSLGLPSTETRALEGISAQSEVVVNTLPGPGATLKSPADGTVTSWAVLGGTKHGYMALIALAPQPSGRVKRVAESTAAAHTNGSPNSTSIPIAAGDMLGMYLVRELEFEPGDYVRAKIGTDLGASFGYVGVFDEDGTSEVFPAGEGGVPIVAKSILYNATVELLPPGLSSMSPKSGTGGTAVTITGQHLAVATGVTFGGVPATSFSGDDTHLTAIAPPRPAGGTVEVQVTTAGGTSIVVPLSLFTYPTPPAVPDTTSPAISSLQFAPSVFRAANIGGSIIAKQVGSRVSYRLSEAATTTFTVQRVLPGRRSGKRCVAPSRRNRTAHRCTRLKNLTGSFQRSDVAGTESFNFSARLNNRALAPGSYRLRATARDVAGNVSKAATRAFTVVH